MSWYKLSQDQMYGYKIVSWDGKQATSLYERQSVIDLNIGSVLSMPGKGVFLGMSKDFCLKYYTDLTDDQDMLLTYSYNVDDIISGDPFNLNSEIQVKQAKLVNYELV